MSDFDPKALWSISYGIYVVTSCHQGKANGQIANTVIQVTAEPPRIAVAINKENYTHELISGSGVLAAAVLGEETPLNFIGHFGFSSGKEMDKLSGIAADKGVTGCLVVTENAVSVFEARVFDTVDAGTHTIFIADVVSGRVLTDGRPMTYAGYHARKGNAPRKAPTYRPPETEKEEKAKRETSMKKYVCDVCGYEYDPADGDPESDIKPGTTFEDLPDDWVCPVCGAGKEDFSPEE